jgi:hypothetical protein
LAQVQVSPDRYQSTGTLWLGLASGGANTAKRMSQAHTLDVWSHTESVPPNDLNEETCFMALVLTFRK